MNQKPVYMWGDKSMDPFISIDSPITKPANNQIAFFTGYEDPSMTRQMAQWVGQTDIQVQRTEYSTLNSVASTTVSPWEETVSLQGTDGVQFKPAIGKNDLSIYMPELARTMKFTFHN